MIKQSIFVATALSIALLFLSCTTPQDVLNDYNKHFEKTPAVTQDILETGNAALMLQELYKVDIKHTLVLTAPLGCESYEWKITDVGGKKTARGTNGYTLEYLYPGHQTPQSGAYNRR